MNKSVYLRIHEMWYKGTEPEFKLCYTTSCSSNNVQAFCVLLS